MCRDDKLSFLPFNCSLLNELPCCVFIRCSELLNPTLIWLNKAVFLYGLLPSIAFLIRFLSLPCFCQAQFYLYQSNIHLAEINIYVGWQYLNRWIMIMSIMMFSSESWKPIFVITFICHYLTQMFCLCTSVFFFFFLCSHAEFWRAGLLFRHDLLFCGATGDSVIFV